MGSITDKGMQAKPGDKDVWLKDGAARGQGQLVGRITPAGSRVFYFRYTGPDGERVRLPIGPYAQRGDGASTFTVQQARDKAAEYQALYRSGIRDVRAYLEQSKADAIREAEAAREMAERERRAQAEAERLAQLERERRLTVRQLFARWKNTELRPTLLSNGERHGRKDGGAAIEQQFNKHVFPLIGDRLADEIRRGDIMTVLDHVKAAGLSRTTNVVLANLRQMFTFAYIREMVTADPTHGISKKRDGGGKEVERDRYLQDEEITQLVQMTPRAGLSPRTEAAIWLILSTACRIGELMGAVWADAEQPDETLRPAADLVNAKLGRVDLQARIWKIYDTKNQQDHVVQLSDFAVEQFERLAALREMQEDGKPTPWVFPNSLGKGPVCTKSINKQLQDRQRSSDERMSGRTKSTGALLLPGGKWTPHDLRRTAATLMSKAGISDNVIHLCLNHKPQDKLGRIYIKDDRMEDRLRAFQALGDRLAQLSRGVAPGSNVVPLRAA